MGNAWLLLHKWHRTVRFRLRNEKTNEIDGDSVVGVYQQSCYQLKSSSTNERSWVLFTWVPALLTLGILVLSYTFPSYRAGNASV